MPTAVTTSFFTPEHDALRSSIRSFIERELQPYAEEWEAAGNFPDWVFEKMGDAGFLGLSYPEQYGGSGGDYISTLVLKEEMVRVGSGGVGMAVAVQTDMATPPIFKFGTEEQKQEYLVPAIKGRKIACLGISEPNAGSDVANIETVAVRDGSDWVINGRKIFITNGVRAQFCTLVARTDKPSGYHGFSLFIVPTNTKGWQVSRRLDKLGMHSSDTAEIVMEDMRLPSDALLGEEGKGFYQIMWELQGERLVASAGAVSGAQLLFDRCLQYVKEREAFGQPIGKFQTMAHRLAEMATEIEAARRMVYDAVWKVNKGEYPVREISMAKLYTGVVGNKITNQAMQIFGGAAYLMDLPIQRAWRDSRVMRIGGGADEIMREIISKMRGL
ncbi:MAG: acyl-CoA dehydrogenase family protein [Actinomycetota bacterium]